MPDSVDMPADLVQLRARFRQAKHADEEVCVRELLAAHGLAEAERAAIATRAVAVVEAARARRGELGPLDAFLQEYGLSNQEGVALLCIAECLLRIADPPTADRLIAEKLSKGDWDAHLGRSESAFVNASAWALVMSGRLVELGEGDAPGLLQRLVTRSGETVIRAAMLRAMRMMGDHFVMGRTILEALGNAADDALHSFDMLGEGARTSEQAERYLAAYADAIATVGQAGAGRGPEGSPGVSIKLSALHPRYVAAQRERVIVELVPKVKRLAADAKRFDINLTIDAEEADRLDLSLDVLEALARDPDLAGWRGLGLAVQAYQKRAAALVDWLVALARACDRRLMVRLVKGAYWDSEIKWAQQAGHPDHPVFTRKATTDLSYLVAAKKLLAAGDAIWPQFATHNAYTIAAIHRLAGGRGNFEFQRLYGMGELLYATAADVLGEGDAKLPRLRVYAPVGTHADLLPYLVRRLLENGANSSFINHYMDPAIPVDEVVADPVAALSPPAPLRHPDIAAPPDLYAPERQNSAGIDLTAGDQVADLRAGIGLALSRPRRAAALVSGAETPVAARAGRGVRDPADRRRVIGTVLDATPDDIDRAYRAALAAQPSWDERGGPARAEILERAGDALEQHRDTLLALLVREGGKTLPDSVGELREAVDFCRYYALQGRRGFGPATLLPGPTGQSDELSLHGRGVFVAISPWNFPLSIFLGQVVAALAAGNAVLAKPAEQTPLVAMEAVRLLHGAGVPSDVLHLLPGDGDVGHALTSDSRLAGVVFTGSTEVARNINRVLAARDGAIVPLIAETGGQNALIVDSTALLEQVVDDAIASAFLSAGQRCSALRVLFAQEEIADELAHMLAGAMDELRLGDPFDLSTDIGPIIDDPAGLALERHARRMDGEARLIKAIAPPPALKDGTFFGPRLYEIERLGQLQGEVFGPILHLVRYRAEALDQVRAAIAATGYGLTFGVHSRLEQRARGLFRRLPVGNGYVNRSLVGAVVGTQPFGGMGLSGTGPKAGGPHYLPRFAVEKSLSVNTAALGGNTDLLDLGG